MTLEAMELIKKPRPNYIMASSKRKQHERRPKCCKSHNLKLYVIRHYLHTLLLSTWSQLGLVGCLKNSKRESYCDSKFALPSTKTREDLANDNQSVFLQFLLLVWAPYFSGKRNLYASYI
jgi:hypothetical protein